MTKDVALAKTCISSMAVNASTLALPNPACKDQIIDSAVKTRDLMLKYSDGVLTCMNNASVPIVADDKTYRMQACQAITKMFADQAKTMPAKPNMANSVFKIGTIPIPQCLIDAKLGAGRLAQLAQCCPKFKTSLCSTQTNCENFQCKPKPKIKPMPMPKPKPKLTPSLA
uniref:Uncharacterized protein n=1 Tax=Romanomermis culicivorax TaxID=13658 RepID=A0A915ISL1_ROMCU